MLVGKHAIQEEDVRRFIAEIKKKKELNSMSEDFVRDRLFEVLMSEPSSFKALHNYNPRSAVHKKLLKMVRARLRRLYGLFRVEEESKVRSELSEKLPAKKISDKMLLTHSSTKERLPYYEEVYKQIFSYTGKPTSIIDLGCGINPFSIPHMKLKLLTYQAYDISDDEIFILNDYFHKLRKKNKEFKGKAEVLDVMNWKKIKKADLCLLFKMTDVLDRGKGHKATELVVKNIPAKSIVVSFPTLTMSGKKMNFPRRKWIELMCDRLKYSYFVFEIENEIFYIIDK